MFVCLSGFLLLDLRDGGVIFKVRLKILIQNLLWKIFLFMPVIVSSFIRSHIPFLRFVIMLLIVIRTFYLFCPLECKRLMSFGCCMRDQIQGRYSRYSLGGE